MRKGHVLLQNDTPIACSTSPTSKHAMEKYRGQYVQKHKLAHADGILYTSAQGYSVYLPIREVEVPE